MVAPQLADGAITLRKFEPKDAQAHLAGEDDEQVRWLSGGASTLAGVHKWIETNAKHWDDEDGVYNFAIWDTASQRLVGMVEANAKWQELDGLVEGDVNVSYGLYPPARGKGYVQRAIKLLGKFLSSNGYSRLVIRADGENLASIRVAERGGFSSQGEIHTRDGDNLRLFTKNLSEF